MRLDASDAFDRFGFYSIESSLIIEFLKKHGGHKKVRYVPILHQYQCFNCYEFCTISNEAIDWEED